MIPLKPFGNCMFCIQLDMYYLDCVTIDVVLCAVLQFVI